jgi:2-amino-4-hydroxy-6-hydroxymethyldihydropteridine diphosphokinase
VIAIGLGGNLGTDAEIVDRFRQARRILRGWRSGGLYRSAPIGPDQPDFLNSAMLIDDRDDVLAAVHDLEATLGRVRGERWGPRTIDLDVLWWDRAPIDTAELTVPHRSLAHRKFALLPMADLLGEPYATMAAALDQRVERIAVSW